ncbi:MAG: nuclear transport factor 2 family protein [Actinomycetota bacterium]|nr:nuclear transport factor 2 family protein [Actinomycetota bacterium]
MSRENVELALRYTAAVNAREVPEELLTPDFRIENVTTAVTDRVYHGAEGVRQWMSDFFDVLGEDARYEARPIADGDDYVVGDIRIIGRGAASGAPVELRHYGVMWARDGKIVRAVGYPTRRAALEADGLGQPREAGSHP